MKRHFAIIALAALAAAGSLLAFDRVLDRHAYQFMGFDETFRTREFSYQPFVIRQFINYIFSPEVCSRTKRQVIVLGSSETSGTYEPFAFSPTAYLNRLLPPGVVSFNVAADGYWLSNQRVLQKWILEKAASSICHPVFFYAINQRSFVIEERKFYENKDDPGSVADYRDFVGYREYPLHRYLPNLAGLVHYVKRPRIGFPEQTTVGMWIDLWRDRHRLRNANDIYYRADPTYSKTERWYERKGAFCDNADASPEIRKGGLRIILEDIVSMHRIAGHKFYYYLSPHNSFPKESCYLPTASVRTFREQFKSSANFDYSVFERDDFADGWHVTEKGNEKLAGNWYRILKENGDI